MTGSIQESIARAAGLLSSWQFVFRFGRCAKPFCLRLSFSRTWMHASMCVSTDEQTAMTWPGDKYRVVAPQRKS